MLPRALFVCVHNAGRSQMAQAFWERLGGPGRSAGSDPAGQVHPEVLETMREVGIDLAGRVPHRLDQADAEWADVVVTMGCGDACPFIPGKRYVDWDLEDPRGRDGVAVRGIRDQIEQRIAQLAGSWTPPGRTGSPAAALTGAQARHRTCVVTPYHYYACPGRIR